ncbi:mitochondrial inner membrane protease subunit 1 isoform X2 [Pezoporus occidentalis]|uniref:mitochondrial inner membrane protease subunit 1 isoform X2 n=1 Tax=Pezoporus occidentalis TaxID=407982 RepID=UPI002F9198BA
MLRNVLGKTFRFLGYTVQYGCIAHCAFEYLGGIVVCSGPSMEPTIQNYDIVFSENLSRHFYCIRKGDIVIVKSPNDPKSNICKRVIGLEGDKVCTSNPSDFLKSHSYAFFSGQILSNPLPTQYQWQTQGIGLKTKLSVFLNTTRRFCLGSNCEDFAFEVRL